MVRLGRGLGRLGPRREDRAPPRTVALGLCGGCLVRRSGDCHSSASGCVASSVRSSSVGCLRARPVPTPRLREGLTRGPRLGSAPRSRAQCGTPRRGCPRRRPGRVPTSPWTATRRSRCRPRAPRGPTTRWSPLRRCLRETQVAGLGRPHGGAALVDGVDIGHAVRGPACAAGRVGLDAPTGSTTAWLAHRRRLNCRLGPTARWRSSNQASVLRLDDGLRLRLDVAPAPAHVDLRMRCRATGLHARGSTTVSGSTSARRRPPARPRRCRSTGGRRARSGSSSTGGWTPAPVVHDGNAAGTSRRRPSAVSRRSSTGAAAASAASPRGAATSGAGGGGSEPGSSAGDRRGGRLKREIEGRRCLASTCSGSSAAGSGLVST